MALTNLTDVKEYLGITANTDDDLLEDLIDRAQAIVETFCNRSFDSATRTEYYDANDSDILVLKSPPVTSITSIGIRSSGSTYTTLSSSLYDFDPNSGEVQIIDGLGSVLWALGYERATSLLGNGFRSVKVIYVGGWSTIPLDLQQAAIELVASMYGGSASARLASSRGIKSESLGYVSFTYMTTEEKAVYLDRLFGAYRRHLL